MISLRRAREESSDFRRRRKGRRIDRDRVVRAQQQRAGLARALALDPEVLCIDEPSAGLDPISSKLLDELILELSASLGTTIVIVTHELDSIFDIATTSVFLDVESRTMTALGPPKELRDHSPDRAVREFLNRGVIEGGTT